MTANGIVQLALYVGILLLLVKPLGSFMARIYEGDIPRWIRFLRPLERGIYRIGRVRAEEEMTWRTYAAAVLAFNFVGIAALYLIQRIQGALPWNPQHLPGVGALLALNTAVSFGTNTNWQSYGGETTLSYLTQMLGLTVQNFVSAATGMAVLIALVRGLRAQSQKTLGNFWVDLTRGTLYILLPLAMILALALVSQGVVQTLKPSIEVATLESGATQTIAVGPAASQIAIKQLGTNGGGFFNANSAHPLENPTPLSNLLEVLAILLIPAGLCYTFGRMVGDTRQGWAILAAMTIILVACLAVGVPAETSSTMSLTRSDVDASAGPLQAGGQYGGQGDAFRHHQLRPLGGGDDGRIERFGQRDARFLHPDRRHGSDGPDATRRGRLRRGRLRVSTECSCSPSSPSSWRASWSGERRNIWARRSRRTR